MTEETIETTGKVIDLMGALKASLAKSAAEQIAERDARISSLESQLEEARRDTERLDWLGQTLTCVVTLRDPDGHYRDHYLHGTDETIREAIDRAADSARGAPHD